MQFETNNVETILTNETGAVSAAITEYRSGGDSLILCCYSTVSGRRERSSLTVAAAGSSARATGTWRNPWPSHARRSVVDTWSPRRRRRRRSYSSSSSSSRWDDKKSTTNSSSATRCYWYTAAGRRGLSLHDRLYLSVTRPSVSSPRFASPAAAAEWAGEGCYAHVDVAPCFANCCIYAIRLTRRLQQLLALLLLSHTVSAVSTVCRRPLVTNVELLGLSWVHSTAPSFHLGQQW